MSKPEQDPAQHPAAEVQAVPADTAPRPAECATVAPLLSELAAQIRAEHQASVSTLRRSLAHALACGRLLIEAHALVPRGQWQQFIKGCDISYRTAARYCQLAAGFDSLTPDQQAEAAGLPTIERAMRFLGSPGSEQAPDEDKQYQVGPGFLAALRACSKFVAAPEDSRHVLHGVHLVAGGRIIRLESTDGQRLTTFRVPFEHEVPVADVVVPADLGSRAASLFRSGQPVAMVITEHEVEFSTTTAKVSGRLIEGKYVPVQEHLGRILKNPRQAVVNVGLLTEAVKRTEIVTQHIPAHPVVLRFGQHERPDVLVVTDEAGHTDTEIEGVAWEGKPFTIMVKSDYLLHHLAQEPKDSEVTLKFSDDVSPMGIVGADGRCGAILPIRPFRPYVPVTDPAPEVVGDVLDGDVAHTTMADPRPEPVTPEIKIIPTPLPVPDDSPEQRRLSHEIVASRSMLNFDCCLRMLDDALSEIEARVAVAEHRIDCLKDVRDRIDAIIERVSPAAVPLPLTPATVSAR